MTLNDKESSVKVPKFECKFCNYITIRESQYTRHLLTRKHKMMTNDDIITPKTQIGDFLLSLYDSKWW